MKSTARDFRCIALAAGLVLSPDPVASAPGAAPAATLLLPYFEIDAEGPADVFVSVVNSSANAVLTQVTLWSDVAVPTFGFPLYLTGYDVATFTLRDVFAGRLPQSAASRQDPDDRVSPRGPLSVDAPFASCSGSLPPSPLSATATQGLRAAHQGLASTFLGGQCAGNNFGDWRVRGFLTIDTMKRCARLLPGQAGYFDRPDLAAASDQNVLWGDFVVYDPARGLLGGEALVRLQADPVRHQNGDETFYGWLHGNQALDRREPLPTTWAARFVNAGPGNLRTALIVWHPPAGPMAPFGCPRLVALVAEDRAIAFDEQETAEVVDPCSLPGLPPPGPCHPISSYFATSRQLVDGAGLPVTFSFGWLRLEPKPGSRPRQSWVGVEMTGEGLDGILMAGTPLEGSPPP